MAHALGHLGHLVLRCAQCNSIVISSNRHGCWIVERPGERRWGPEWHAESCHLYMPTEGDNWWMDSQAWPPSRVPERCARGSAAGTLEHAHRVEDSATTTGSWGVAKASLHHSLPWGRVCGSRSVLEMHGMAEKSRLSLSGRRWLCNDSISIFSHRHQPGVEVWSPRARRRASSFGRSHRTPASAPRISFAVHGRWGSRFCFEWTWVSGTEQRRRGRWKGSPPSIERERRADEGVEDRNWSHL